MKWYRVLGLTGGLLVWGSWSDPAWAQSAADKADADALFEAARQLMEDEKYEAACPKLKDSFDLDPGVGTLLNLGLCYKKSGRSASAWSTYREAASMARKQSDSAREELARAEVEALEGNLVKLVVEVSPEVKEIDGLEIVRQGEALRSTMWGIALPVDPGEVTIEARAPGYKPRSATVKAVGEGRTIIFKVPMLTKDAGPAQVSPESGTVAPSQDDDTPPRASETEPEGQRSLVGPLVLGGFGVAALAAGGVFAIVTSGANKNADGVCPDQGEGLTPSSRCTNNDINDYDYYIGQAETFRTLTYVGFGVGGAAVIGAATWLLLGKPKKESALVVEPQVGSSWGLAARGTF